MNQAPVREPQQVERPAVFEPRYPVAMGVGALLALLVSAWAGLAPFIGPSFGYAGAGGGSLHWDLGHGLLAVAPAVAGIAGALVVLGASGSWRLRGGRGAAPIVMGGTLTLLAGVWLAIGWAAWGPLEGSAYLAPGSFVRHFADVAGLAIGPGLLLVAFGALVFGLLAGAGQWRPATRDFDDAPRAISDPRPFGERESVTRTTTPTSQSA